MEPITSSPSLASNVDSNLWSGLTSLHNASDGGFVIFMAGIALITNTFTHRYLDTQPHTHTQRQIPGQNPFILVGHLTLLVA